MNEFKISKVFIADDHPLFRVGLKLGLSQKEHIRVIGEAENGIRAVEKILKDCPDIALIDLDMPGLSGVGAIRMLRKAFPNLKILVISAFDDDQYVMDSMRAGADGYVLKSIDVETLVELIDGFCKGEEVISPYLLNQLLDNAVRAEGWARDHEFGLTVREKEILRYLAEGKANKEIANILFISAETVKSHLRNIFKKLNAKNRLEAVKVVEGQKPLGHPFDRR
jgi:DNA-binding NarL/FixJ family response regulator